MKKPITFTITCGVLLAFLAVPALAATYFGPVDDLQIVPDKTTEAYEFTYIYNSPKPANIAIGTVPSSTGILEAKVIVDVNHDGVYDVTTGDTESAWSSGESSTHFVPTSTSTNVKLLVRGDTAGSVALYSNAGTTLDTSVGAIKSAHVTIETSIPEFPTLALPVAGVLGLLFIFGRKKEGL